MNNISKAAGLLLAGITTGVILGMLFAPNEGRANREKLTASLQNLGDTIIDTATVQIDSFINLTDTLLSQFKSNSDLYAASHDDIENAII